VVVREQPVRVAASKHAWRDLTPDETIAIGEKLKDPLKGISLSIFCNDSACDDLAHDIDDAMQIADVRSTLDRSVTPLKPGIVIVASPNGAKAASALADAIAGATATSGALNPSVTRAQDVPEGALLLTIGSKAR
jgi:hypothetical protein